MYIYIQMLFIAIFIMRAHIYLQRFICPRGFSTENVVQRNLHGIKCEKETMTHDVFFFLFSVRINSHWNGVSVSL